MQRLATSLRANNSTVYNMRQSGATLQQIADEIGKTKERARQILVENYGSTKHQLISTEQLCKLLGLPRNQIIGLYQGRVIIPAVEWDTGAGRYLLWFPTTAEEVDIYYKTHRLCRMCPCPIPKGRQVFCSEQCYKEGHKYRYKSIEAKQRHIGTVKRYSEEHKSVLGR